jgi:hypothetical protein
MLVVQLVRSYWLSFRFDVSRLTFHNNPKRPFLVEAMDAPQAWLRMRLRVLRRDRFRCRACDKRNEEVLLTIHSICPGFNRADEILTLCLSCRALAKHLELKGANAPDFLSQLWRHLYRPVMPTYVERPKLNSGSASR